MLSYRKICTMLPALALAIGLALGANVATAAIVASDDFASGTLTGGSGAWGTDWASSTTDTTLVADPSSFALDVGISVDSGTNKRGAVHRQYTADATAARTITFDFTIDSFPTAGGNAARDRFNLSSSAASSAAAGASSSWIIYGGEDLSGLDPGLTNNWAFHDGLADGSFHNGGAGENSLVDSGIALVLGNTYNFTIVDDPSTANYVVSVNNSLTPGTSFTSASLGYRAASFSDPYMLFSSRLSDTGDTAGFTLDNVLVSLPDPPPPMSLEVNTDTGFARILNGTGGSVDLNYYEIGSDAGLLDATDVTGWISLDDQNHDPFPGGDATENWTEAGGSDANILSEANLLKFSTIADGDSLSLGSAFNIGSPHDLIFKYALSDDILVTGLVTTTSGFGDMNGDGVVDTLDVDPFVMALTNRAQYEIDYSGINADIVGDFNSNGKLDMGDISPFATAASPGAASASAVPEPSSLLLLSLGLVAFGGRRRK